MHSSYYGTFKTIDHRTTKYYSQDTKNRFEKNIKRHNNIAWSTVETALVANKIALWSINEMEQTGGEPDVVQFHESQNEIVFVDCSIESPKGRRSLCYDRDALDSRKDFKPANTAIDMASEIGIKLLTEDRYRHLQTLGTFDTKTSSWLQTPSEIRKLGGALFAEFRYGTVFIFHNSAPSYYGVRGFRGFIII